MCIENTIRKLAYGALSGGLAAMILFRELLDKMITPRPNASSCSCRVAYIFSSLPFCEMRLLSSFNQPCYPTWLSRLFTHLMSVCVQRVWLNPDSPAVASPANPIPQPP